MSELLQFLVAGLKNGCIYALVALGFTVVFAATRAINFAQGDFMMLGMYAAYYLFTLFGVHLLLGPTFAPYIAALAAGPVIYLLGILIHKFLISKVTGVRGSALEADGHYAQLILTLGIALIMQNGGLYLFGSSPVTIQTPLSSSAWELGPFVGDSLSMFVNQGQTIAAFIAIAVVLVFVLLMARSRMGKSLRAAADNPEAAIYMGIDVDRAYRIAFGFGVAITAIGGGLLASSYPFQPYVGIDYVIVMYAGVVLGGMGSVGGAFFGGMVIGLIQQISTLFLPNQLQNTAIFVIFLLIILLRPQGLFGKTARRT